MKLSKQLLKRHRSFILLMLASIILLFSFLGFRDLWTQEHRWAEIVSGMFYRQDFLHPFLGTDPYYDKPLLSYWLIIFASSILEELSLTALRLPSAIAALIAIVTIYRIGVIVHGKRLGLTAGWMLLTAFYFLFWARTSSADMLNLSGILVAFYWYLEKRNAITFFNYVIFFSILAVTSLCKGLTGAVVPLLAILPDLVRRGHFRKHINWKLLIAILPALMLYFLPFWASAHIDGQGYSGDGLAQVYRENFLRYFEPFDHRGPFYTYFIFLPVYLLPWTVFFIPALLSYPGRFKTLPWRSRWFFWIVVITFLFFTFSGSRRNYYALCIVPFAILMTAEWIIAAGHYYRERMAHIITALFFPLYIAYFVVLQPLNYLSGGSEIFVKNLESTAIASQPWREWQLILLDPKASLRYHLKVSPSYPLLALGDREAQTAETLLQQWPILCQQNGSMIFITRALYRQSLAELITGYTVIDTPSTLLEQLTGSDDASNAVAYIPTPDAHCILSSKKTQK